MNKKTIQTLEFDKILKAVEHYAVSDKTKSRITPELFSKDISKVRHMIDSVDDATQMLRLRAVELGGITDIMAHIKRAEIGGILSVKEFNDIRSMLNRKRMLDNQITQMTEDELELPKLYPLIHGLEDIHFLYHRIVETMDEEKVLDHASEKLLSIRRRMMAEERKIKERLNEITRSNKKLSDNIVTMRNNRYVVPVKVEHRSDFKGIVHDMSASGQTVYIEPMQIVQMTNLISELKEDERIEVERILAMLTTEVAEVVEPLKGLDEVLHTIDMIFAKAKYGVSISGSKPQIYEDIGIHLPGAFHPLIASDSVVKNDIFINEETKSLIITGPNTGGKTVTLKTIGLTVLMAQSGIPIPCRDGGTLKLFESVYSDIGDEQSIEQSLSTFSSHMTNITKIIDIADENSLVLLDELGAGTDPEEGAALAISIIEHLLSSGSQIVATTHYSELKSFSYSRDDVMNASVEFDVETLSPTYRLMMGIPGKSNAFDISHKLGLNPYVIERARELTGHESNDIDKMIEALERHTKQARENDIESEVLLKDATQLHDKLSHYVQQFEHFKETLEKNATIEINRQVKENAEKADKIIQELEALREKGYEDVKDHELIEMRKSIRDDYKGSKIKRDEKNVKDEWFKKGDSVEVLSYGQKGDIIEVDEKLKEAVVQMGIIKMKLPFDELKKRKKEIQKSVVRRSVSTSSVKRSLDLRGERYEDALVRLDKYLDQALLQNFQTVEIIHGKGTGALQKGVQQSLKKDRRVKSFRGGMPSEGGFGVTIVEMK